jgi:hypothetical protein
MAIGGSNGRQGTGKARQLHADMEVLIRRFTSVEYDLTEISPDGGRFEDDYAQFSAGYKSLQVQAVTLLQQAFEDLAQPVGIADLLIAFSSVLACDAFRMPVDKIAMAAIELFARDLNSARVEFVENAADDLPPGFTGGLPPVAGKLKWLAALQERVLMPWQHLAVLGDTHIRAAEGADAVAADAAGLCEAIDCAMQVKRPCSVCLFRERCEQSVICSLN